MENICGAVKEDDDQKMELPPGFRFHPSDEELITHYLSKKVVDNNFDCVAIGEVDMNKVEPWDLPWKAKMGEKEWYFFCLRDKKYPTGLRTNRATAAGYWKATGKDKAIFRGKSLIGMKKTLVFYRGRAPRGEKSNWVIHEFRLEGKLSLHNLPKTAKNEWVICRVFQKSSGGKKIHISGLVRMNSAGNEMGNSFLPPLTDSSPYYGRTMAVASETSHVHCFSNSITAPTSSREDDNNCFNNYPFPALSNSMDIFSRNSLPSAFPWNQTVTTPLQSSFMNPGSFPFQDPAILRTSLKSYGQSIKQEKEIVSVSQETGPSTDMNTEISSFEDQEAPPSTAGAQFLDCLWNY